MHVCHRGLPRLRGDGPHSYPLDQRPNPAPPPTRGWSRRFMGGPRGDSGSPAYAGMVPKTAPARSSLIRLPRLRGDGPDARVLSCDRSQAPPPTRGWSRREDFLRRLIQGSPAYAGMVPDQAPRRRGQRRLPRLRGDGPSSMHGARRYWAAPPPTRGWSCPTGLIRDEPGGSPAYAGMVPENER